MFLTYPYSLSGSSLCYTDEVPARQRHGPALGLYGSRFRVALFQKCVINVVGKTCFLERHNRVRDASSAHVDLACLSIHLYFFLRGINDLPFEASKHINGTRDVVQQYRFPPTKPEACYQWWQKRGETHNMHHVTYWISCFNVWMLFVQILLKSWQSVKVPLLLG